MTIQDIIKKSLHEIKERGLPLTPEVYGEIFCKHAKKANVIVEECQRLEKYLKRLSPEVQKQLRNRHVTTVDQLVQYLGSQLERSNPSKTSDLIQAYVLLIRRLLQTVTLLHDKQARQMAEADKERVTPHMSKEEVDAIREHWADFVINYDDSFLNRLTPFCPIDEDDCRAIVDRVVECVEGRGISAPSGSLEQLAELLAGALTPSIAPSVDEDLATVTAQLKSDPELLTSPAMLRDIREMIRKRVELDKKAISANISELDEIMAHLTETLRNMIKNSDANHEAICQIQIDLEEVDFAGDSIEAIHKKLLRIAEAMEKETRCLNIELEKKEKEAQELRSKIRQLEEQLRKERKRAGTDTLTRLPNRRAIDDFIEKQEAQYQRYGDNYSVVLFDIDHFKSVNDTYGHDAGDVVLASFGRMLRRYSRQVDFTGRWGGEEFLVVLPKTDKEGAKRFADKLREVVAKSKFMYKGTRIPVTVSGGVAERAEHESLEEMLKKADDNLYKAKANGRNQIVA